MDAACAENIVLVAWEGFGVGSRYAATHGERVTALVLYEPMVVADDDWAAWSAQRMERSQANMSGEEDILALAAPSRIADRTFREWYMRAGRVGASPSTAPRIWESVLTVHQRESLFEQIESPTLVLHRRENAFVPTDVPHLDIEDAELLPIAAESVDPKEWDRLGEEAFKTLPMRDLPLASGVIDEVIHEIPKSEWPPPPPLPIRVLIALFWRRKYRKYMAPLDV